MSNYPKKIKQRTAINLKTGIKSSLSKIKSIVALTYLLYKCSDSKHSVLYSQEVGGQIKVADDVMRNIKAYFKPKYKNVENIINENPLFKSQLESLQVGLTLVLQLGKINFEKNMAAAAERMGGNRFNKRIDFSTNIVLLDLIISDYDLLDSQKFLFDWLQNEVSENETITSKVCQFLSLMTQNTVFKLRTDADGEIFFQTEGVLESILENGNAVIADREEIVGPNRVYNSFIKEGLDPWIRYNNSSKVLESRNDGTIDLKIESLTKMISTTMDISLSLAKQRNVENEVVVSSVPNFPSTFTPVQRIYFGTPGSGKSHKINELTKGAKVFRTTFHPDYDFASFVGCYKPVKENGEITYNFVPQCFTNAYIYAWNNPNQNVFLIIEEINRGNCAQIFGDVFQLLDRNENGFSSFAIQPNQDLKNYLEEELGEYFDGNLSLPPNLNILASMNTSDQSLFPMDSAFKRRWDWEYVPINYNDEKSGGFEIQLSDQQYLWSEFLKAVNSKIKTATDSEDKQMGNFFIRESIKTDDFISKVMFYLWSEILKDEYGINSEKFFFRDGDNENQEFTFNDLSEDKETLLKGFFKYLGVEPKNN